MTPTKALACGPRLNIVVIALTLAAPAGAGDWPQFRGPNGAAVSEDKGFPTQWGKAENVAWKAELPGRGVSSPVVAGGKVFVTACTGYKQDRLHVLALDAATGKKLWERQFWATGSTTSHPTTCTAGATPVTDGKHVFALFSSGDLVGLDVDGNLLWVRSLARDYPGITNQVGMAASPVVAGKVLLLPLENAGESFAAGLDKLTGQNLWKVERLKQINWVTPVIAAAGDRVDAVFQTSEEVTAYDPETGKVRWTKALSNRNPVPAPLFARGLLLVPGEEFTALRPGAEGREPEVVWKTNKLRLGYPSALYYQDRVYALNGAGVLNCADAADGKVLWQERIRGKKFWSSPVAAGGKVYVTNEEGTTTVVDVTGGPKVVATNELDDTVLATPALADGAIFMRSDQYLYCIKEKK